MQIIFHQKNRFNPISRFSYFVEEKTNDGGALKPEKPYFAWDHVLNDDGSAKVKVKWLPTNVGNAGSHFYVKYR